MGWVSGHQSNVLQVGKNDLVGEELTTRARERLQ